MYVRANGISVLYALFAQAKQKCKRRVYGKRKKSSSRRQQNKEGPASKAACAASEKVIHMPWHFQPAFLAVWAIAHAYATFVAAHIGIISAHGDHVGAIQTGPTHG